MNESELKIYLPKFLSAESFNLLLNGLKDFPENIDSRMYTTFLKGEKNIFQGDCLDGLHIVNIETLQKKNVRGIILSNTCDIDPANQRLLPASIVFAPLIGLSPYIDILKKGGLSEEKLTSHISSLKRQSTTHMLYLPSFADKLEESVVFLDKIHSIPARMIDLEEIDNQRVVSLSDYGSYMFLFKISMHFTRIQDKVERGAIKPN